MTSLEEPPVLSAQERRKQQKRFQERKVHIVRIWGAWKQFETVLEKEQPEYLSKLNRLVIRISQEIVLAKTRDKHKILWDEARNRILTSETLEPMSVMYGKSYATIVSDVSRVASHNSWMAGINRRMEYSILAEVIREWSELAGTPKPQFAPPVAPPLILTAAGVNELARKENAAFASAEQAFLGDTPPPQAKTGTFGFIAEIDRMGRFSETAGKKRKPRKNWRKEI